MRGIEEVGRNSCQGSRQRDVLQVETIIERGLTINNNSECYVDYSRKVKNNLLVVTSITVPMKVTLVGTTILLRL